MCATFMIKQRNPGLLGISNDLKTDIEEYYDKLIVPYTPAPVVVDDNDVTTVVRMKFSLVPSWSTEPRVKFATHNARLETIDEKPTWKSVFVRRHCLVPLTDFIEPIYSGEYAGNMVGFSEASGRMLFAAGLWDEWTNKQSGEVLLSFAIITYDPPPFVADTGHDRCPVFLLESEAREWLGNEGSKASELKSFLFEKRSHPDFNVEKFRAMKPGWEKRKS